MDNDDPVVIADSIADKDGYGPLSQYMAESSVSLYQYSDKVLFKLNLLETDEDIFLEKKLEIPSEFKASLFCQAVIAYCYSDNFKALGDRSIKGYVDFYQRFFSFLLMHDENCEKDKLWSELVAKGNDLPYTVIHEFLLYLSESGTGANTLFEYRGDLRKPIYWASSINIDNGNYNFKSGDKLVHYLKKNVSPEIKRDDVKPKPALSQLFSIDYETGEEIECPYTDSQLVTNLRWFAIWYLNIMRERRLFFRQIKWNKNTTIYEVLIKRLNNGTWSIDSAPVKKMFGRSSKEDKAVSLPNFYEASSMYAKIYEALLPSKSELESIENGTLSAELTNKLLWLEPLLFNVTDTKVLLNDMLTYQNNAAKIIERTKERITYNRTYSSTQIKKGIRETFPIFLSENQKRKREVIIPNFNLADMIVPTNSERQVISWLLSSDCIQWSNQVRLNLSDFKQLDRGKTLQILTSDIIDDINVNEGKIRHHKERGKGGNAKNKAKRHETITYKSGDPLLKTYTKWFDDMTEAQAYLTKNKGKFFHNRPPTRNSVKAIFPLSFLCAKSSFFQTVYDKHEKELKYHSQLNGQGAFKWLLTHNIKHFLYVKKNVDDVSSINLNIDSIRQSRIIFNESQDISDAENAKETAHNEDQVAKYREAGVAKERILNGLKGNVQVANKIIDEALSILDSCHIMSVEEVQKSLHDPSGFTIHDVNKLINEIAANSDKYDVTIFGGIIDKNDPHSGIKIINDKNSALMMWSYIKHMESELQAVEENHDEEQVVKHLFEHAQWSILFERFPDETQKQAKALAEQYTIPYPPLF